MRGSESINNNKYLQKSYAHWAKLFWSALLNENSAIFKLCKKFLGAHFFHVVTSAIMDLTHGISGKLISYIESIKDLMIYLSDVQLDLSQQRSLYQYIIMIHKHQYSILLISVD